MKVLVVAPFFPWPLDNGGKIRSHQLLSNLAQGAQLHLVALQEPGVSPADSPLPERCASLEIFEVDRPPAGLRLSRAKIERWFHSSGLRRHLRERLASERFDLVHVEEMFMAASLPERVEPPLVVNHHKIDRAFFSRVTADQGPLRHFDLWKLGRLEGEVLARTRHHVVCSPLDRDALLQRRPDLEVAVVPNGFDETTFQPTAPAPERDPQRLLLLGTLSYAPNVDGLRHFLETAWDELRARHPQLVLELVGRDPTPEVESLLRPGVELVGSVPDVRPYLARAALLVVPLRIGGGTRLKIVEALGMETPVVSTPTGAEGLDLTDGEHLLLADGPALGAAVHALLQDPARARSLARAGRERVLERYRWSALAAELGAFWKRVLAQA